MNGPMLSLQASLFIMVGGALGAWLRMWIISSAALFAPGLPWGMILVNILGSLLIGFLYQPLMSLHLLWLKYLLIGGLLGALTTFSTFALDVYLLWDARRWLSALTCAAFVPILSILAVFIGALIYRRFL